MRIGIVGGGAAGLFCAIKIKEKHPQYDVVIIEQNDKLGKKILATGNGKCNLANTIIFDDTYNNVFARSLLQEYSFDRLEKTFLSFGIPFKRQDNLVYPFNESAKETVDNFVKIIEQLGIVVFLNTKIIAYTHDSLIHLQSENTSMSFDHVVFTTGGKSTAQLGSDGSLYSILMAHNYAVSSLQPGLCPIKTTEKTKLISGQRVKALVSLVSENKLVASEAGEVLFKDDGLSGIVIFNMASRIARHKLDFCTLELDLFPQLKDDQLVAFFAHLNDVSSGFCFLKGLFNGPIYHMLLTRVKLAEKTDYTSEELFSLARLAKKLIFHFKDFYGFDNSQVTIGGVNLSEVDSNLCSRKEQNVHFAGEILNIDGLCGGYNLMWAFASAWKVADNI